MTVFPKDAYLATLDRMEPDIVMVDAAAGWASIAISLKRIADAQEKMLLLLSQNILPFHGDL